MKNVIYVICWSLFALTMASCQKDDGLENPLEDKMIIAEKTINASTQVQLLADKDLVVGFQQVYIRVLKDGKSNATDKIEFSPVMDMGTMKHGAPTGKFAFNSAVDAFQGFVVFTMPTADNGTWAIDLKINNETLNFPVVIKPAATRNVPVKSFTAPDNKRYILTLVQPSSPKIGINDLEVMVFWRENMFSFPVQDGLTLDFHPEMTSMNHGSSNNVNPQGSGAGIYKGKVNFSMSGDWRLFFNISKGETQLGKDVFLDVLF
ncbi:MULTISPECIES: FixH family protein [unclassified Sphingobacterium]|uniref:FixH family protein n=1 Tax=unclassified Sphingobacterium TaxID=2609468 RepID=UPI0020C2DC42|nr:MULTISPECIES: FixH family protein [unclassified Sphingobacterium]